MSTIYTPKVPYLYGTGRRKSSSARVKLFANGTGAITVNGRTLENYFGIDSYKLLVKQPLTLTETEGQYDVLVNVTGGGLSGQAGAIRLGIARALLEANAEYRPILKSEKLLTRNPKMKERKKYGLKGARRAPQFSKR